MAYSTSCHLLRSISCNFQKFLVFNNQKMFPEYLRRHSSALAVKQSSNVPSEKLSPKPVWSYNNKGIRQRKIKQLLRLANEPDLSGGNENVQHTKRIVDSLISTGFTRENIEGLLIKKPRIFELSKKNLTARCVTFKKLGLPNDVVLKMILKCPALLCLDLENSFQNRLNVLQNLSLFPRLTQQRSLYLVQKCPSLLLACDELLLKKKLRALKLMGFNPAQLFELIMKHPAVLTYSTDSVKEKVKLVHEEMGARIALFVKFPRMLSTSTRRIRERYEYLKDRGFLKETTRLTENKMRGIVLTTDKDFVKLLITKTPDSEGDDDEFFIRLVAKKLKQFKRFSENFWIDFYEREKNKDAKDDSLISSSFISTDKNQLPSDDNLLSDSHIITPIVV